MHNVLITSYMGGVAKDISPYTVRPRIAIFMQYSQLGNKGLSPSNKKLSSSQYNVACRPGCIYY